MKDSHWFRRGKQRAPRGRAPWWAGARPRGQRDTPPGGMARRGGPATAGPPRRFGSV